MRRVLAVGIVVGWLMGVISIIVAPQLANERLVVTSRSADEHFAALRNGDLHRDGWRIVRVEGIVDVERYFFELERPRLRLLSTGQ